MKKIVCLFAVSCIAAMSILAGEVGNRKMVFAHNTPWFRPSDGSLFSDWYFNYPLAQVKDTPEKEQEGLNLDVRNAIAAGLDGMFLDFGASANGAPCTWWWTLGMYLKAAEGTDFQVGMCLDHPSSAEYWGNEIVRILKLNGNHPNYPRCGGKYVLCTYCFLPMTPETWRGIRRIAKDAGFELYVIANVAPMPKEELDLVRLDRYLDCFDCLYMFDSPGHAPKPPRVNNRILSEYCAKKGKRFMPCLHPGYYGAWLVGNDFYGPFRGIDQLWDTYDTAREVMPQWIHMTTWNDLMETAVLERAYTFGQVRLVRYFAEELKGLKPVSKNPEVIVAYHREEIPGTLLRFEAASLPCVVGDGAPTLPEISGRLLTQTGECVYSFESRVLKADVFSRVEWLVPTTELAKYPELTPEFTVKSAAGVRTVKTPAVYFVSSWNQNAVTVTVPLNRMVEDFANTFSVQRRGSGITAEIAFDSPEPIRRATLVRNDRPLAVFSRNVETNEYLLPVSITDVDKPSFLVVKGGHVVRAVKKGQSKAHPACYQFDWNKTSIFTDNTNYGPIGATFAGSEDATITLKPKDGSAPVRVSLRELSERQRIKTEHGTLFVRPDMTHLDEPALEMTKGKLSVNVFQRAFEPRDRYYVRYETMSGRVFMTPTIHPFADTRESVRLPILETDTSLETSSGCAGLCYFGGNEFLTPREQVPVKGFKVREAEVSSLINRRIHWAFDGDGVEESGNFAVNVKDSLLATNGVSGGCLVFRGDDNIGLPSRTWPIGGFGHIGFYLNPCPYMGEKQCIVNKDGWSDGLLVALLPDGRLEVTREYNADPSRETVHGKDVLVSRTKLAPGRWTRVAIDADAVHLTLSLDGKVDGSIPLRAIRSYGNGRVYIGGGAPDTKPYRGLFDELEIEGIPHGMGAVLHDLSDGKDWSLVQCVKDAGKTGTIVCSRLGKSADRSAILHLRGLRSAGAYVFTDAETGVETSLNGTIAERLGLRVELPGASRARTITYRHLIDFNPILRIKGEAPVVPEGVETDSMKPFPVLCPVPERLSDANRHYQGCPSVTVSPGGRLWAAVITGDSTEGEENVNVVFSSGDGGRTWTKPLFAVDCPGPLRVLDCGLWTDPQGRVWFFYAQLYGFWDGRAGLWVKQAIDPEDPNTAWTPARRICDGYLKNKPTVLKDGRILLPIEFFDPAFTGYAGRHGHFVNMKPQFVHDSARYNQYNAFVATDGFGRVDFLGQSCCLRNVYTFPENMIVERKDGSLWMLGRTAFGIGEASSTDGGRTWSDIAPSKIPHPSARFYLGRLKSGALLLVKNGDMKNAKGRNRICAFVSDDDGATWKGGLVLDSRDSVSYPDAVQASDGFIYVVNDHDREGMCDIRCHRFTEADVRAGRLVTPGSRLMDLVSKAGVK